jgi:adenylosuccinate lyase
MPHKRNPVNCERISGLSRVLRGHAMAGFENVALWHERDISHSSVERVILPDSTILLDFMLSQLTDIISGLHVYPKRMLENLEQSGGLAFSSRVLVEMVKQGADRQKAYESIQACAMTTWKTGKSFQELLQQDPVVTRYLSGKRLERCFDYTDNLRNVNRIFKRIGL